VFGNYRISKKYLGDAEHVGKYLWAAMSLWNNVDIISAKFSRVEIKLFQIDVDESWNNFEIVLFHM